MCVCMSAEMNGMLHLEVVAVECDPFDCGVSLWAMEESLRAMKTLDRGRIGLRKL